MLRIFIIAAVASLTTAVNNEYPVRGRPAGPYAVPHTGEEWRGSFSGRWREGGGRWWMILVS